MSNPPARPRRHQTFPLLPGSRFIYASLRPLIRFIFFCTVKVNVVNAPTAKSRRGYILACTHISHLEGACVSLLVPGQIDWIVRQEFYRQGAIAWMWRAIHAFPIRRRGVTVRAIRTAIERVREGRIIGVFPEGGVAVGQDSVCRGGPIKPGVCLIAAAAQAEIVPVVILGTEKLNCVRAWLPFRRSRVWIIFGQPLPPPAFLPGRRAARERRRQRLEFSDLLRRQFAELYRQLLGTFAIDDRTVP